MNIYVFGLGHIGLPMATWIALKGYKVIGIDINAETITQIKNGTVNIQEQLNGVHISKVAQNLIKNENLSVYTTFNRKNTVPSVFLITVGISDKENGLSDISPLINVIDTISPFLVDNDLLIIKTTMIPGTCDSTIMPRLNALKKKIHLAYCPETIIETKAFEELEKNTRILAASDDDSFQKAEKFLKCLSNSNVYKTSNFITAEMVKVVQNITRDVDICLINEISNVCSDLEIDVHELRKLVNTHPRIQLLSPGPGVGGYCLPNALKYLEDSLSDKNQLQLTRKARELNEKRPFEIVKIIKNALSKSGKNVKGSKIAIIGLAMKDYCADCRYSPAITIASELILKGAEVCAYDSLAKTSYPYQTISYEECIKNADCMLITANQFGVRFEVRQILDLLKEPAIVVDTRNTFPADPRIRLYRI